MPSLSCAGSIWATGPTVGKSVAVVGGGNSAVDAARTALRLGAKDVTIVYRRTRAEMRAYPEEINEAIREGVNIVFLATPSRICTEDGRLRMECLRTLPGRKDAGAPPPPIMGSEFTVDAETVIVAVGQEPEIPCEFSLPLNGKTIRIAPDSMATAKAGVFAGADCVTGPRSVIEAIAAGRQAAIAIDRYLGGRGVIEERLAPPEEAMTPAADRLSSPDGYRECDTAFVRRRAVQRLSRRGTAAVPGDRRAGGKPLSEMRPSHRGRGSEMPVMLCLPTGMLAPAGGRLRHLEGRHRHPAGHEARRRRGDPDLL